MTLRHRFCFLLVLYTVLSCPVIVPAPAEAEPAATGYASAGQFLKGFRQRASSQLCRVAVQSAEIRYRLPPGMLWAMAQVELARPDLQIRRPEPWPWTVQALGKGQYFETKSEAVAWVRNAEAKGITSIDTGCLQINLFFHPHAFRSLDEAFDPERNADYAGRFLRQLYAETGDWQRTTGLYHSRTTLVSMPYQQKVSRAWHDSDRPFGSHAGASPAFRTLAEAWATTLDKSEASQRPRAATWNGQPRLIQPTQFPFQTHIRLINVK